MTDFFGTNAYKFGLFGANCGGGMTLSAAPERWRADWDEIVEVYRLSDDAGIEFILPIAKWHGLGGAADMWGRSYETFTHSAAAGALTKRIGVFVTAHVPICTPAFAAKAITTIDHVTHGRVGLNIVCGWNPDEFNMHGIIIDGERRYDQGLEWFKVFAKVVAGGGEFDWDGEFYHLKGVVTDPLPLQRPRPPIMSAGGSETGRNFAAQAADILFTSINNLEGMPAIVKAVKAQAAAFDRNTDVYVQTQIVCKPTRKEAEDFYYYFAEEQADQDALDYYRHKRVTSLSKGMKASELPLAQPQVNRMTKATGRRYSGTFPGVYPLVGSPDDIVEELSKLKATGISGSALIFLNYLQELPYFVQEVLPRMEKAGLRQPLAGSHATPVQAPRHATPA